MIFSPDVSPLITLPRCRTTQGKPNALQQAGGVCFWNGKYDPIRARERVMKLIQLFQVKYPNVRSH